MARKTQDKDNVELERILQELLHQNIDITAREIARRHSLLSSASTITRHVERRGLLERYQAQQKEMRSWEIRQSKRSKDQIAEILTIQQEKIKELDRAVHILTAGHLALIAAIAQVGGMRTLSQFYESFREVRNILYDLGALPADKGADISKFSRQGPVNSTIIAKRVS